MFKTGIELVTGVPGAGKSFFLVERLVDWILINKRPVYTNLPLKHRVLQEYLKLKGGEHCAGLIYELHEERFNRFLVGFEERQKFIEKALTDGTSRAASIKLWEQTNPGFLDWWIPAGSVIVMDEVHHWYPNPALANVKKREPPALMTFLTMHRHGQYLVVFATQADRQVSNTIKTLIATRYMVRRWDKEPILGDMSLEFLNFPILKYDEFAGEDDPAMTKPIRSFTRLVLLPWYQIYFRLYESFTHSGGKYEAQREVEKKRLEAGLETVVPKSHFVSKSIKFIVKWFAIGLLILLIGGIFYRCGAGGDLSEVELNQNVLTVKGASNHKVYLKDDTEVRVSEVYKGAELVLIYTSGKSFWKYKDKIYGIKVGGSLITDSGEWVYDD